MVCLSAPIQLMLSASRGLRVMAWRKLSSANSSSFSSKSSSAELMVELAVLRTFALQLEKHCLGHNVLLRGHQCLHRIAARRPMARIQPQRLKKKRDGLAMHPRLEVQIAEVAPAVRQVRRDLQRRPVVRRRRFEIPAQHVGIAEIGAKLRNRLVGIDARRLYAAAAGPSWNAAMAASAPPELCRGPGGWCCAAAEPPCPTSGKAMANEVASMFCALFTRKTASTFVNSWLTESYQEQRWPDWKSVLRPLEARKGLGSRVICLGEILTRRPAASDHLENRSGIIIVKPQIELMQIGDGRRNAQAEPAAGIAWPTRRCGRIDRRS